MGNRINALARHFLGKESIEDCNLLEISELSSKYPYSSAIEFLLLEKLRVADPEAYQKRLGRSILYYHDPMEFQLFIQPERFHTELPLELIHQEEKVEQTGNETGVKTIESAVANPPATPEMPPAEEKPIPVEVKPSGAASSDLVFEPYHTVDYFASQGIRLSQEEVSSDKFGKQLKSFTEWLKTMKKIPPQHLEKPVDAPSENRVQHLAQDSLHQADVVTEAMAEVWIKQGNVQKAIEVYNKLSLLNPSKKAYFAAQIENLKRS